MATSNAAPPGFDPSPTPRDRPKHAPRLLDHLASWRPKTAQNFAAQIGGLFAFVRRNVFGAYVAAAALSVLARGLNLLALAGTIKIASLILFNWEGAIKIAGGLGLSTAGATKSEVAWMGAAIILFIYLLAGIATFISNRTQITLVSHAERVLYQRYLNHPSVSKLLNSDNFRSSAPHAITTYTKSCLSLALIPGLATLCAIIILILAFFQPALIALVVVALLPLLLLYLLTGRRASAANAILKATEAKRRALFKAVIPTKRQPARPEKLPSVHDEILDLTDQIVSQRVKFRSTKSIPEAALAIVAGCVLATAMIVLTSTPTNSERLIYLLIGFVMIRFMFVYLKAAFGQIQSIVQNLDEIRFINRTILSDTIGEETEIRIGGSDEASDDLDEMVE